MNNVPKGQFDFIIEFKSMPVVPRDWNSYGHWVLSQVHWNQVEWVKVETVCYNTIDLKVEWHNPSQGLRRL